MVSLRKDTGEKHWTQKVHALNWTSMPTYYREKIYFGQLGKTRLICLNARNGNNVWQSNRHNGPIHVSPLAVNNRVYIQHAGMVTCYPTNTRKKKKRWQVDVEEEKDSPFLSPAYENGRVFAATIDGGLYCLEASSGNKIWNHKLRQQINFFCVRNGKIFFVTYHNESNHLLCLDAQTRKILWRKTFSAHFGSPAVAGNRIFVSANNGIFYCLSAETGDEIWTFEAGGITSFPVVAEAQVFFRAPDSGRDQGQGIRFVCLDAITGEKHWEIKNVKWEIGSGTGPKSPALADGDVFFETGSHIYQVDVGDLPTKKNWPMYRGNPGRTGSFGISRKIEQRVKKLFRELLAGNVADAKKRAKTLESTHTNLPDLCRGAISAYVYLKRGEFKKMIHAWNAVSRTAAYHQRFSQPFVRKLVGNKKLKNYLKENGAERIDKRSYKIRKEGMDLLRKAGVFAYPVLKPLLSDKDPNIQKQIQPLVKRIRLRWPGIISEMAPSTSK